MSVFTKYDQDAPQTQWVWPTVKRMKEGRTVCLLRQQHLGGNMILTKIMEYLLLGT